MAKMQFRPGGPKLREQPMPTPRSLRRFTGLVGALATLACAACGKDAAVGPAPLAGILVVQGDNQSGQVGRELPTPIVLRAVDSTGNGMLGRTITLIIGSGGGTITPTAGETDSAGEITATWTLGPSATTQSLLATAPGLDPIAVQATGIVPSQIVIVQGSNQTAKVGAALPIPIVVRVLSAGNVPMIGIALALQVTAGGGSFTPQTVLTNATGEAVVVWTLGPVAGANAASIQVSTLALAPVTISATGTP
jgi:hypothetical protein